MDAFKVGISRRIITPEVGCELAGYFVDFHSTAIHDDLTATAFAFQQGSFSAIMVSATVVAIGNSLRQILREQISQKTGVEKGHIFLSATHTHSGPNTMGHVGWGEIDQTYCDSIFIPQIVQAAVEAWDSRKAGQMGVAETDSYVGINRREINGEGKAELGQNPWGCFDRTMTVISFRDIQGALIGNMIHYGAHCTAAGANHEITRDWPGVMCDILERETGVVTAFFNGAEGDVGPRLTNGYTTGKGDIRYALEHGAVAGADAVRAFRKINTYESVPMALISGTIEIPYQPKLPLEEAKRQLEAMCGWRTNRWGQQYQYLCDVIAAHEQNLPEQKTFTLPQTIMRLGPVVFIPLPYETFSEIALRLKQGSPFAHTICLGLTYGNHGYFPTKSEFPRGGYEVEMFSTNGVQILTTDADSYLVEENLRILENLHR